MLITLEYKERKTSWRHTANSENLLSALPQALREDAAVAALAQAAAELLACRPQEIDRLRLYPAVGRMEEPLLDILAHDFKVDWWDGDYSLEEKRRTLADSWKVHKILGTKAAVETAISAIFPESTLEEWFQYGGEPYHFRLRINATNGPGDRGKRRQVLARLDFYKSLRSHNDGVTYFMLAAPTRILTGCAVLGSLRREHAPPVFLAAPPPRASAQVRSGGGLAGRWGAMGASLALPPLTPHGARAHLSAGGGSLGRRRRMYAGLDAPALALHGGAGAVRGGGGLLGLRQQMEASVPLPGCLPPVRAEVRAGCRTGLAGLYQRIKKEVPIYGTLG